MKKQLLLFAIVLFALHLSAQTYTIGDKTITYTDPVRSNRSVGVQFRYPGTNSAVTSGQFPFVIFAHGFSMDQTPYFPYADSLAKRGYIVGLLTTETGLSPSHANFAQDLLFVYNKLIAENSNNASFFYQHVIAKGAFGGHSMGGGSTVLSAQYGNPQECSFTFAAATTNPSSISAAHLMTKPYLSFAGSSDCIAPIATNQQPMYDSSGSSCKFLINITNGLHCQYGNANSACSFGEGFSGCASSTLTRQQQIDKTLFHLIPFLDYYLKGDCSAWTLFETRYASNTTDVLQRNCTNTVPANASISGTTFFCDNNSTTLTANLAGFQYLWSNNSTANTLAVNAAGNYSVIVGNGVCSLASVSASVTQNFSPVTPSAISSADTVCSNISNLSISVINDAGATYNWTLPSGWSITSGTNTNSITATSGINGGTVSVTAQNSCGTSSPVTATIAVVPSNLGTPGTINGTNDLCAGTSSLFSVGAVNGANAYSWTAPNGWSSVTLNPSTSIDYTVGDSSGIISVSAVNNCGQSIPSTINVTVHTIPTLGILYGTDSVCLNNYDALNFSLSSALDADSIVWSASNPWNIIGGQGSSVLSVNSYMNSGSVSVYASNECGTTSTLSFDVLYVDTPQITITQQGSVLSASSVGAVSYQWYNSSALISGANAADYTPTASGDYTVSITNQYGCSTQSAPFSFVFTALNETHNENSFRIFPNPNSTNRLQFLLGKDWLGSEVKITDATGRLIDKNEITNTQFEIELPNISSGVYIVSMEKGAEVLRKKLIIE